MRLQNITADRRQGFDPAAGEMDLWRIFFAFQSEADPKEWKQFGVFIRAENATTGSVKKALRIALRELRKVNRAKPRP